MLKKFLAALLLASAVAVAAAGPADLDPGLAAIQEEWARIKYRTPAQRQADAFDRLAGEAQALSAAFPERAEPRVWEGIVLATYAGAKGGLGALKLAKRARKRLQEAEAMDPRVLDGSVYTSLGSLYFKVPGWPLGFGDDDKARQYLNRALEINPEGIDPIGRGVHRSSRARRSLR